MREPEREPREGAPDPGHDSAGAGRWSQWLDGAVFVEVFEPAYHELLAERLQGQGRRGRPARLLAALVFHVRVLVLLVQSRRIQATRTRRESGSGRGSMSSLWRELVVAWRGLRRRPGFTALAVLTLALGIGANAAIFSVVNGVLLRDLPYPEADRLVLVWGDNAGTGDPRDPHSPDTFRDYVRGLATADAVAGVTPQWSFTLTGDGEPERVFGYYASASWYGMLGVQAVAGRTIQPADDTPEAEPVVMISHGLWQRRFGGSAGVVGQSLRTSDGVFTIVGVVQSGFRWRDDADVFAPLARNRFWSTGGRQVRLYEIVARRARGVTLAQASANATAVAGQLAAEHPDRQTGIGALVVPLHEDIVGSVRGVLMALLAAVGLVLLIACVNVASLLLVRGDGRRGEVAVRAALGASQLRIARELLVESGLLSLVGCGAGLLLAFASVRALRFFLPAGVPRREEIMLDGGVVLFALGLALLSGLLFGLAPAIEAARSRTRIAAGDGSRVTRRGQRLRASLVMTEVAIAVMVAVSASMLVRSFANLRSVDAGFDPAHAIRMDLSNLPAEPAERAALMERLWERLQASGDVVAVGEVTRVPLATGGNNITSTLNLERRQLPPEEQPEVDSRRASRGYFAAMRIPLLTGRNFLASDDANAEPVALLNRTAVRRFFPGENPIGQMVQLGGGVWSRVVGVVGDIRHASLAAAPRPEVYLHTLQVPSTNPQVIVRTNGDPLPLVPTFRSIIRTEAPDIVISRIAPLEALRSASLATPRFQTLLFALFAVLALVLATVGAYGIMAYAVAQRRRELGVRVALGARPGQLMGMVLGEGAKLTLAGVAVGIAGALATTRLVRGLLYEVDAIDLPAYGMAVGTLALAVLGASLVSGWRAARVDPVVSLQLPT